ncbi:hypothetical protein CMU87_17080 [Elizabethkingia anophelis]|nr:hypothetical protein [Elizabethkingia anophelis]
MRGIIFRGKRQDNNEWVYGSLNTKDIHHGISILTDGVINNAVIPETVGQFTGEVYRNGDKIFEGDKVKADHRTTCEEISGTIKFIQGCFWVETKCCRVTTNTPLYLLDLFENTGNKHEPKI